MYFFIDISSWIKYFLEEDGTPEIKSFIEEMSLSEESTFSTSAVTYAEMIATFKRASRGRRISEDQYNQLISDFKEQWKRFDAPEVDEDLVEKSGELAEKYVLKGCDAFQLASAVEAHADVFISSDLDLNDAAGDRGFIVWNPVDGVFPVEIEQT